MKRTHDANIGGTVFHVDEDAYARLEAYLKSITTYFASFPDQADIVADIEGRIAEQLLHESGPPRIVTIASIERVIATMGSVEQFAEVDIADNQSPPETAKGIWRRRLYRDMNGRIIAGVASGIAAFVNVNPIVIRALFVLLLIPNNTFRILSVLLYLAMWIFVPVAKTTTENLRMRGRAVTLATVEQKVREQLGAIEHQTRGVAATVVFAIGSLIRKLVIVAARLLGGAVILAAAIGVIVCTVILVTTLVNARIQPFGEEVTAFLKTLGHWEYLFILCSYMIAAIPLVIAAVLTVRVLNTRYQFKMQWSFALLAVWFVSLLTLAGIGAGHLPKQAVRNEEVCTFSNNTVECTNSVSDARSSSEISRIPTQ